MIRSGLFLLLMMALPACRSARAADDARLAPDVRACRVPRAAESTAPRHAVACAEDFIARNGYTSAAVADTTQLASESIEYAQSAAELVRLRQGGLQPRAFGVCEMEGGSEFTVVFLYARGSEHENGRAVTMSGGFDRLRVQHRDFILANVRERRHGCRPAADA